MEEPTIVESKRQKKVPPPRPPPPAALHKKDELLPADPIPRSHTVSGDMPRRPKYRPAHPERLGGSPAIEKKSAADPVPPPRRKRQQRIFPENNPNTNVREGFTAPKEDSSSLASEKIEGKQESKEDLRSLPTRGVRPSEKRKEAQRIAKIKVSVLA